MNVADLPGAGEETLGKVFDPLGLSDMQPYGSKNQEWMRTAEVHAHGARADQHKELHPHQRENSDEACEKRTVATWC